MEFIKEDKQFLAALGWALLALLLSAIILFVLSFVYVAANAPGGAANTYSKTVPGKQLRSRMGTAQAAGDGVEITGFKTHDKQQHALISLKTAFRAENYPFLSYQFEGWHTGMRINFIWRTASNPRGLSTTILNRSLDNPGTLNLAKEPNWQGTITEIGLHIVGESRDEPLIIPELIFQPYSWRSMAAAVWSEWTAFRGWSGTSINYLNGTPGAPGAETISPTVIAAMWSGLAILIVWGLSFYKTILSTVSYGAVILISWIILDSLWQRELSTQNKETHFLFAGKSVHEKHLSDIDKNIYAYTKRLKDRVLENSSSRVFILRDSGINDFDRLKAYYYLLPHNSFYWGIVPPQNGVYPGDYLVALGEMPQLRYQDKLGLLEWGTSNELKVRLIDSDPLGQVYQVLAVNEEATKTSSER